MPSLMVRNLDEELIKQLKARAVAHQRSTEAEHRAILAEALMGPARKSLAEVLAAMPNVGLDSDFERMGDDAKTSNVFD